MIKCLFFPFTRISPETSRMMSLFFETVGFFSLETSEPQPWTGHCDGVDMTAHLLPGKMVEKARIMMSEYQAWAMIHKGNEHNLKALLKDNPYYTSETHIPAIKSQIRGTGEKKYEKDKTAVIENDLLFLMLAAHVDEQQEILDEQLKALEKNREHLFAQLCGEAEEPNAGVPEARAGADPGSVMPGRRIGAWSRCMGEAGFVEQDQETPLYVTHSPAVFEYIETNCSDALNALDITDIKVHENNCKLKLQWRHQFLKNLVQVVKESGGGTVVVPEVKDGCRQIASLKLSFFSGEKINTLFNITGGLIPVLLVNMER